MNVMAQVILRQVREAVTGGSSVSDQTSCRDCVLRISQTSKANQVFLQTEVYKLIWLPLKSNLPRFPVIWNAQWNFDGCCQKFQRVLSKIIVTLWVLN